MEERGHLGIPGAAVHRHILDRMNAINDSLEKRKKKAPSKQNSGGGEALVGEREESGGSVGGVLEAR